MNQVLSSYMRYFSRLSEEKQNKRLAIVQMILEDLQQAEIDQTCEELLADVEVNE
jgi:hypothetical protein